jgi:hypothetical protein
MMDGAAFHTTASYDRAHRAALRAPRACAVAMAEDASAAVATLAAAAVGAPSFKDAIATLQAHAATHPALGAFERAACGLDFARRAL